MNNTPRKPDYDVCAMLKSSSVKGKIGAAWKNTDGSVSITLSYFIQLPTHTGDLLITLFPIEKKIPSADFKNKHEGLSTRSTQAELNEEPPF